MHAKNILDDINFSYAQKCFQNHKKFKDSWSSLKNQFFPFSFVSVPANKLDDPGSTTNPSPFRKFCLQKIIHKKLLNFSEKVRWQLHTILRQSPKHLKRYYFEKIHPYFDVKKSWNIFYFRKYELFRYLTFVQ